MNYEEHDHDRDRPAVRAGDADRDRVAETLRRHHQAGRLTDSELEGRLERCYRARTLGELDRLVADLPRPEREWRDRGRIGMSPALVAGAVVAAVLVCASIAGAFWHGHYGPGPASGHPHPPLFLLVVIALVVWRLVVRRRRSAGTGWR